MNFSTENSYYLGYLSKVQGTEGYFIAFLDVDAPQSYAHLDHVLVEIDAHLRPFMIEELVLQQKGFVKVKLEGISDRDSASTLAGNALYLPLNELPKLPPEQYYLHELKGMEVIDAHKGSLGKVTAVLDYDRNALLQLFHGSTEVLIPLRDPFVVSVDKVQNRIQVDLPEGLIELNAV